MVISLAVFINRLDQELCGNRSNSANYRAIALRSLFCKMFDDIVLERGDMIQVYKIVKGLDRVMFFKFCDASDDKRQTRGHK